MSATRMMVAWHMQRKSVAAALTARARHHDVNLLCATPFYHTHTHARTQAYALVAP